MTPEPLTEKRNHADDLSLPPGFKMTELGPLPEEWRVVRLGEVAKVKYGKAKPKSEGTVPVIGSGGIFSWADTALIDFPTLVVGRKGTAGQVWLIEQPCWPSDTTYYLVWKQPVDVQFLFGFLSFNPLSGEHAKTTLPSLQRPDLENCLIPLPPLPEQKAIAHVLRTVQDAKEAAARVIQATRELKKSLMRHLFTYGPVPLDQVHRVPLRETDLGPLPAHWQVVRLGEVVSLGGGVVDPANYRGKRYVGLEHIDSGSVRINRWGDPASVSSAKSYFTQNQILYGKLRPYLDKAALADFEGICSTDILVFEIDQKVANPLYVAYLLHTKQFVEYANSTSTGVNHPRTSWTALRKWEFPLPPLPEQQTIARILQAVDRKIAAEEARQQALEALFKTLLHHLMTGQVRVVPPTAEAAE